MAIQKEKFYRDLGLAIQEARKKKGWTQIELADKAGAKKQSVMFIERGEQNVPIHLLIHIAYALGVDMLDLIPKRDGATDRPDAENQWIKAGLAAISGDVI